MNIKNISLRVKSVVATILLTIISLNFPPSISAQNQVDMKQEEIRAKAEKLSEEGWQLFQKDNIENYQEVIKKWEEALPLWHSLDERLNEALLNLYLGRVYGVLNSYNQAIIHYEQAIPLYQQMTELENQDNQKEGIVGLGVVFNNLGELYRSLSKYPQALEYYEQSLVLRRKLKDANAEASTLNNIGSVYWETGDYPKALSYYEQALNLVNDLVIKGYILHNIGSVYDNQGNYKLALDYYGQALAIRQGLKDNTGESVTLNSIASVYDKQGNYDQALQYYQQALVISQEFNYKILEGAILNNIGAIYNNQGNYNRALEYYQQALTIRRLVKDLIGESTTLDNMGETYSNRGDYAQALQHLQEALEIRQSIGDRQGQGSTLHHIASLYDSLGQNDKALAYYEQALIIRKSIGDRRGQAATLNNIATVYDNLGDYTKTLESYQQALKITQDLGDRLGEATVLNNLGTVAIKLQHPEEALGYYQKALTIYRSLNDRSGESTALGNLGGFYHSLAKYAQALEYYQQALDMRKSIGDRGGEANVRNNTGVLFLEQGKYLEAEEYLRECIKLLESLRPGLTDTDKVSIFDTQVSSYRLLQIALIAQEKTEEALEIAERGRARALIELLASKSSNNSPDLSLASALSIEQIQNIAQKRSATLIEYSQVSYKLYIWVINPNGKVTFRQVDLEKGINNYLENLVAATRQSLGVRGRKFSIVAEPIVDTEEQKTKLQQLNQILIAPIADLLPTDPNAPVIFIPQGELFLVPFAALQDAQGKYLIQKHTILTAPSIQILDLTQQQRKQTNPQELVIVGNPTMPQISPIITEKLSPLPGAEKEALAIAQLLQTSPLIGNAATKTAILAKLPQARIVHFATHGLLDDFQGLGIPGAIALAPDGNDSGLLTAQEIFGLQLQAELVVLSACDTGRGRITGDGVIGLSRSLISAGVPSVIVSLWAIPDAPTASLMTEFYRNWQGKKLDKAQALRQAMLTTMKTDPEPRNWAAFTLIGEAD